MWHQDRESESESARKKEILFIPLPYNYKLW